MTDFALLSDASRHLLRHGFTPEAVATALEGARRGIGYQLTYRVVCPDGCVRTVLETAEPAESWPEKCG